MGSAFSYEEPQFEACELPENAKYEMRKYPAAKWTSTSVKAPSMDQTTSPAFRRLFNYIRGENDSKNKISMTVPVTMAVSNAGSSDQDTEMVMSFYIPENFQDNPPAPSGEGVFTESRDKMTVYVRRFSGRPKETEWVREFKQLCLDLEEAGIKDVDVSTFYAVGYDSPIKLFNRRNEVWVKASVAA